MQQGRHTMNNWEDVGRYAESQCVGNNGFGVITIKVAVHNNRPLLWDATLSKFCPQNAAFQLSPEILAALGSLLDAK